MRIQYAVSGGLAYFPRLATPRTLDTDALSRETADDLKGAVAASNFFALPAQVGMAPPGAADLQTHTLTIEDHGQTHTVRILESVPDPALQELVNKVVSELNRES